MPITSSWYQCSVEAQLALMSDSMQFIFMPWLSWHSTHFLNAGQREERAFSCCCTRSFQPLPSWESPPTTPSSLVSTWVTFFVLCGLGLISANTLWKLCHCVPPAHLLPQPATQRFKHSTCPTGQPLPQADMAPELPPAPGLETGILFLESNMVGVSNYRKK